MTGKNSNPVFLREDKSNDNIYEDITQVPKERLPIKGLKGLYTCLEDQRINCSGQL